MWGLVSHSYPSICEGQQYPFNLPSVKISSLFKALLPLWDGLKSFSLGSPIASIFSSLQCKMGLVSSWKWRRRGPCHGGCFFGSLGSHNDGPAMPGDNVALQRLLTKFYFWWIASFSWLGISWLITANSISPQIHRVWPWLLSRVQAWQCEL